MISPAATKATSFPELVEQIASAAGKAIGVVFEAYEHYWRKMPVVKRLVFKGVPEETTRVAMLKRQEVDITFGLGGALAEEVRRDPRLKLEPVYPPAVWFAYFTQQWDPKSPWHDRRVRLAANYAIDRQAIDEDGDAWVIEGHRYDHPPRLRFRAPP